MATAPRPGTTSVESEDNYVTITIHRQIITAKGRLLPETVIVAPMNLPIRERTICRKATGMPLSTYLTDIDLDSIVVLWWLGRRMDGEVTLTWDQASDEWPTDLDIENELTVTFGEVDDDATKNDPEVADHPES